ncbi:hypothetical protein O9929_17905 [Vibrio lentus]|nr:hypothetical protein [Vibrio lentus]
MLAWIALNARTSPDSRTDAILSSSAESMLRTHTSGCSNPLRWKTANAASLLRSMFTVTLQIKLTRQCSYDGSMLVDGT